MYQISKGIPVKKIFSMILILGLVTPEMQVHGYSKAKVYGGTAGGVLAAAALGNAVKYGVKLEGDEGDEFHRNGIYARFNPITGNRLYYRKIRIRNADGKYTDKIEHVQTDNLYINRSWDKDFKPLRQYNPFNDTGTIYGQLDYDNGSKVTRYKEPITIKFEKKPRSVNLEDLEDRDLYPPDSSFVESDKSNDSYTYNPKSKHQYTDNDGNIFTVKKEEDMYTKYFKNRESKTYYNNGFLWSETLEDGTVKTYNGSGLIASAKKGNTKRVYFYENRTLTRYEDIDDHGNNIGNGTIQRDGGIVHLGQNNSGITITEDDRNGTVQMDKGPNKVVVKENQNASLLQADNQDNQAASGQKGKNQKAVNDEGNANADSYTDANEGGDDEGGKGSIIEEE
jgi:hypothetical protein